MLWYFYQVIQCLALKYALFSSSQKLCPSSRIKSHGLEGVHLLLNFYFINSVIQWKVTLWYIQVEYWNVHDVCTNKCVHAYTCESQKSMLGGFLHHSCVSLNVIGIHKFIGSGTVRRFGLFAVAVTLMKELCHCGCGF